VVLDEAWDLVCLEKAAFDVAYMTELDPLWSDDELSFLLNAEGVLFGNSVAQACSCHPLGRSDLLGSFGKSTPKQGEDFGYLIWRKRSCCALEEALVGDTLFELKNF